VGLQHDTRACERQHEEQHQFRLPDQLDLSHTSSYRLTTGPGRSLILFQQFHADLQIGHSMSGTSVCSRSECERMKRQGCASADTPVRSCRVQELYLFFVAKSQEPGRCPHSKPGVFCLGSFCGVRGSCVESQILVL
jgi:hypothetical protein